MSPAARVKADIEMDSKIFIYSVQGIESDFLESNPKIFDGFELAMTPKRLTEETIELSKGSPAICAFVNDVLDSAVLERLAENGVRFILMRCAGYNVRMEYSKRTKRYRATVTRDGVGPDELTLDDACCTFPLSLDVPVTVCEWWDRVR